MKHGKTFPDKEVKHFTALVSYVQTFFIYVREVRAKYPSHRKNMALTKSLVLARVLISFLFSGTLNVAEMCKEMKRNDNSFVLEWKSGNTSKGLYTSQ